MAHEYDNAFRTMEMDCPKLMIPVVNEIFHKNYPLDAKVKILPNEQMITTPEDEQVIRITDSNFMIIENVTEQYHIECESNPKDKDLLIRMFQYDTQIALEERIIKNGVLKVALPKSAVIYLRQNKKSYDVLKMVIEDGSHSLTREIPVVKIQKYSLAELFDKRLLFFLPFYIFIHEKELSVYNVDEEKRKALMGEYEYIIQKLEKLEQSGEIDELEKQCIITSMREVLRLIAKRYQKIVKDGERVMGGELLEYPAKTSYREGLKKGREDGIKVGMAEGKIESIRALMENLKWSAEEAMESIGIPKNEQPNYLSML